MDSEYDDRGERPPIRLDDFPAGVPAAEVNPRWRVGLLRVRMWKPPRVPCPRKAVGMAPGLVLATWQSIPRQPSRQSRTEFCTE